VLSAGPLAATVTRAVAVRNDSEHAGIGELLTRFAGRTAVVVGDVLLDGWITGRSDRLCREAPAPVVNVDRVDHMPGGAANVAVNLTALGARTILVGVVGDDPDGATLRELLADAGVDARLATVAGRPTVSKRRVVSADQILLRLDRPAPPWASEHAGRTGPPTGRTSVLRILADLAAGDRATGMVDAWIVCDYGAGAVRGPVHDWLVDHRDKLPLLAVDAHEPARWAGLSPDLATPSFAEAVAVLGTADGAAPGAASGDRARVVADYADELLRRTGARRLSVTLDVDGSIAVEKGAPPYRTVTDPVPDRYATGAGDVYLAAATLALASGATLPQAAEAGQLAAASAMRRLGTAVLDPAALRRSVGSARERGVGTTEADLMAAVAAHRAAGRQVVFTNGCFDVLHRGHVCYLRQAKRLGDILIVAVNSDESVRRLKGPGRPVSPEEDRVMLLEELSCVDYVVVFDELSPGVLIERLRPDIYVKGGDYRPDQIPEGPLVTRLGGRVVVVGRVAGRSSTEVIARIVDRAGGRSQVRPTGYSYRLMDGDDPVGTVSHDPAYRTAPAPGSSSDDLDRLTTQCVPGIGGMPAGPE
jgi:D-beta-D-heptose 7-phosphate kinase / D-beta-D-heptose 1-phosphate adenosyltransferase